MHQFHANGVQQVIKVLIRIMIENFGIQTIMLQKKELKKQKINVDVQL